MIHNFSGVRYDDRSQRRSNRSISPIYDRVPLTFEPRVMEETGYGDDLPVEGDEQEEKGVDRLRGYFQVSTLGHGSSGLVTKAINNRTKQFVAIKKIPKLSKSIKEINMIYNEIDIMQRLRYRGVIKLEEWFETPDEICIITEMATGGELLDRLLSSRRFTERDASKIARQILGSLSYLHSKDIVHGDLKLENVLYKDQELDSPIMIIDFGVSKLIRPDKLERSIQGTMGYMAPEFFPESNLANRGYNREVDIFAMGVITFVLLYGYFPFKETKDILVYLQQIWEFDIEGMKNGECISMEAKGFIQWCLMYDPLQRATSDSLLTHPWVENSEGLKNEMDYDLIHSLRRTIHEWR